MKVALYARVSTDDKGQNPEVQLSELRAWAARHGHKIVMEYVDHLSGKNTKRPQLQKLMKDAVKGLRDIDAVVVWKLDRFGRSQRDLLNLVEELQAAEIGFISYTENFDLTSPMGKAMFGILCVFAELERNNIRERTKAGLALARSRGRVPGPKIDPKTGPCRMTRWRQRQRALKSA